MKRTRSEVKRDIMAKKAELEALWEEFKSADRCSCSKERKPQNAETGFFSYRVCPNCDFDIVVTF